MTLVRVVKKNCLQTFKEIYRKGKRLNIHKTTFLCQTHEKNCWRKVRLQEEKVYYKKYMFLKHAYDVVNYGINHNLKFQTEEPIIDEETSYLDIDKQEDKESYQYLKNQIYKSDEDLKKISVFLNNINKKYNDNEQKATKLYYNIIRNNFVLYKSDFFKRFAKLYNSIDLMLIYYYLKKAKLLNNKKKYFNTKLNIVKSRKNVSEMENCSYTIEELSALFDTHSKKIGVI